jgi:hypothetical protein
MPNFLKPRKSEARGILRAGAGCVPAGPASLAHSGFTAAFLWERRRSSAGWALASGAVFGFALNVGTRPQARYGRCDVLQGTTTEGPPQLPPLGRRNESRYCLSISPQRHRVDDETKVWVIMLEDSGTPTHLSPEEVPMDASQASLVAPRLVIPGRLPPLALLCVST